MCRHEIVLLKLRRQMIHLETYAASDNFISSQLGALQMCAAFRQHEAAAAAERRKQNCEREKSNGWTSSRAEIFTSERIGVCKTIENSYNPSD